MFRAEDSNTRRHLCEFTGLDMEMVIHEHYYEVLECLSTMFIHVFDGITEKFAKELQVISQVYPFEPLKYHRPTFRITFAVKSYHAMQCNATQHNTMQYSTMQYKRQTIIWYVWHIYI